MWKQINIFILVAIAFAPVSVYADELPTAVHGLMDLQNWQFNERKMLNLSGEWLIKRDRTEYDPRSVLLPENLQVINIPGYWNNQLGSGKGTYWLFLRIKLDKNLSDLGFYLKCAFTAYELYINGTLVMKRGVIGKGAEDTIPQLLPNSYTYDLRSSKGELLLAWKLANYFDYHGGPFYAPRICNPDMLNNPAKNNTLFDIIILGILIAVFFFHFILWLTRKKNLENLYFSFCCLVLALRIIGDFNILSALINVPSVLIYEIEMKMIYLGAILLWYFFPAFYNTIINSKLGRTTNRILLALMILFSSIVLFSRMTFFSELVHIMQFITIIICLWIVLFNILAVKRKREGALIILLGILTFCVAIINDILYVNNLLKSGAYIYSGFVIFIFSHSAFLSMRLSKSLKNEEYLTSNLKQEVQNRTRELQQESQRKIDFFINIAHEIKTPLTIIRNYFEKYTDEHAVNEDILIIKSEIDKLTRDITNLMDIEKLEQGNLLYGYAEQVNLSGLIRLKLELFRQIASQKQITLEDAIEDDIVTVCNPNAIERILYNLIENAIKYVQPGGIVTLSLKRDEGQLVLAVRDNGPGIPPEQQENIFKKYYQISQKKSNSQGIGVGLYLVSIIIKEIGGRLELNSKVGEGSEFRVVLGKAIHAEQAASNVGPEPGINQDFAIKSYLPVLNTSANTSDFKYNILLVEDNINLLNLMINKFSGKYNIFPAQNGIEALELIEQKIHFDLIISDVMMDKMDGMQFLDAIQRYKLLKGTPFIFLTAKSTEADKLLGLKNGALEYIYKPFNFEELFYRIESIFKMQALKRVAFAKEKYSAMGKLYAGIAHQILNPITGIDGHIQVLKSILKDSENTNDEIIKAISFIEEDAWRIIKTVNTLRKLSYNQSVEESTINILELIDSIIFLLPKHLKNDIHFKLDVPHDLFIFEEQNALTNILLNIVTNSIDAINESCKDEKGRISITCLDKPALTLIIEDNGVGIEEKHIPLIFDIDYTTKSPGKGTGLGLFVVKELAEKINWSIKVESKYTEGTRFILTKES